MNKSVRKFILAYLIIGIIWGLFARFPFGVMLSEYSGNHSYTNKITSVSRSFLTSNGDLILCLKGRLADSERYKSEITDFSLKIPIQNIMSSKDFKNEYVERSELFSSILLISEKLINENGCSNLTSHNEIAVVNANVTPKEAYDFYSERDLEGIRPSKGMEFEILTVPKVNSFQRLHFVEGVDPYILMNSSDINGNYFYEIGLSDTWLDRKIGIHEYAIAFIKDALFYPVTIVMMGNWGH